MTKLLPDEELQFPATLNGLVELGNALRHYLHRLSLSESWIYPLDLALCEAASNVIRHGYQNNPQAVYRVRFCCSENAVTVTLFDCGSPIPAAQLTPMSEEDRASDVDLMSEGGRGMQLIFSCVDRVDYYTRGGKNQLWLLKNLPPVAG